MGLGSADADGWRRRRLRRQARARLLLAASGPAAGSGGVTVLHGHIAERTRGGGGVRTGGGAPWGLGRGAGACIAERA